MSIFEKLSTIQNELKVPKAQYNQYGGFSYRSAEDILEAAKPILKEHKTVLLLSDEVKFFGNRYYVEATAKLIDLEGKEEIVVKASAREDETKKGMDGSQITGAASSYARKYALNGLFNIDDTKDADAQNNNPGANKEATNGKKERKTIAELKDEQKRANDAVISDDLKKEILTMAEAKNYTPDMVSKKCRLLFSKEAIDDLTQSEGFQLKAAIRAGKINA